MLEKKTYAYAVIGFLRQPNEEISPFNTVFRTEILFEKDVHYINLKRYLVKLYNVKDVFIFSIIMLQTTLDEGELVSLVAEEIANDRDHRYRDQ